MPPSVPPLFAFEGVSVRANGRDLLDGVDAVLPGTGVVVVIGPSGSGKSTLLQCAAALDRPTSGRVFIDGTDIAGLNETALTELRREAIGFVFQAFNLLPTLTAEQNVALPMRFAGRKPDRRTVQRALAQVGLEKKGGSRPSQLSGGQQQRVAIARALAARPAVLFADEPTGALDLRSAREVLALLRSVVHEHGQTIVMVTHDPVAAANADSVLFLADGRLAGSLRAPTADAVAERLAHLGDRVGVTA